MFKKLLFPLVLALVFAGCKSEGVDFMEENPGVSANFERLLHDYYEDGLRLNPISATTQGDMRYNDRFPDLLSATYEDKLRNYYSIYKSRVSQYRDEDLSVTEQMSKDILLWECNINLEALEFDKAKYMPIDQMWSVNLFMGQLASGEGAQPFKTVQDYENWLSRVDGYLTWMQHARENMREGMKRGYVLPASLIRKVIPQMGAMTGGEIENHLFFSPVLNFPESFTSEEKNMLIDKYRTMVAEKVIPAYEQMHDFLQEEYLPYGRKSSGIDDIPNGERILQTPDQAVHDYRYDCGRDPSIRSF